MKKKWLLIAALASMATMLYSCSDNAGDEIRSELAPVADRVAETDYISLLSNERYDGYNFRIFARSGQLSDQYLEEDTGDVVTSAVYKRNKFVEERYGITITGTESSSGNYETDALNSILAGDDAYR